jgi:protoheme IX farnesyltransferase
MALTTSTSIHFFALYERTQALAQLSKLRLSSLVVFSALIGYGLAVQQGSWTIAGLLLFGLGSLCVTASANSINQILEKDLDRLMNRTRNRPLPTGRLSVKEAVVFAIIAGSLGMVFLYASSNLLTVALAMLSLMLYAFVYTPLKRVSTLAVPVGAIPGALPPLIGWVAVSGSLTVEPLILFSIQFIWQFPHFWAIAWVLDDDYRRAGFQLLPGSGRKDVSTALQIVIYTLWLIPLGIMPTLFGLTGIYSGVIAIVSGSLFLATTFYLMKDCSMASAKRIMFGSFLYLPVVQIAFLLDKL